MQLRSRTCARAVGLAVGLVCPAIAALAADDVATVRFSNRSWNNPTNWDHTNAALDNTVPNNTRENDYDVVVTRTVDLDLDVTVEKGLLDGGQISDSTTSPNTLRFNDVFTFRNGFLQANTTAAGGIAFDNPTGNPFIERANLQNLTMANWTAGGIAPIAGGGITNAPGATFYARADAANLSYFSNDLTGFFNNQGTFVKRGAFRTDIRATFDNAAVVNVEAGELRFVANSFGTGRFNVSPGARVFLSSGTYNMRGNAFFAGEGLLEVGQFGNLRVGETGQPAADVIVENLLVNRGDVSLRGGSKLRVGGVFDLDRGTIDGAAFDDELFIEEFALFTFVLANGPALMQFATLNNRGTTTVAGGGTNGLTLQNGARIVNSPGGTLHLDAPATVISTTLVPGSIVNRGTMNVRPTAQGGGVNLQNVDFENRGDVRVRPFAGFNLTDGLFRHLEGEFNLERDASLVLFGALVRLAGGELIGAGTVQSNTPVEVGTEPGSTMRVSPGQTPGKLTIQADVTMGDNAELFVELSGRTQATQYDLLDVIGTAALDGDLLIDLIDGFEFGINASDVFTVMTADAPLAGAFDNVANGGRVTGVDGFATFQVNYGAGSPFDPNSVVLSNVAFIPEPGAGWVACIAATLLKRRRR